jgi:hypothetical protein
LLRRKHVEIEFSDETPKGAYPAGMHPPEGVSRISSSETC